MAAYAVCLYNVWDQSWPPKYKEPVTRLIAKHGGKYIARRSTCPWEMMEGAPPDDILVYDLLDEFPETQEELFVIRDKVMKKPIYVGGLVSSDAELGAVIVEINRSSIDAVDQIRLDPEGGDGLGNLYPQVSFEAIEAILARPEYEGIEFFHTGDVAINATYNTVLFEDDMPVLMALLFLDS